MKTILPVLLVLALSACGNKGPLVLASPPKTATEPAQAPAPAVEDTAGDQAQAPDPQPAEPVPVQPPPDSPVDPAVDPPADPR